MTTLAPDTTRTRILHAALELFTAQGYAGTSLRQIAERLGITKAALYHHFETKDELLGALISPMFDAFDVLLVGLEVGGDSASRRVAALDAYLGHLVEHRAVISYFQGDMAATGHPAMANRRDLYHLRLSELFGAARSDLDAQVRIDLLLVGLPALVVGYAGLDDEAMLPALRRAALTLMRDPSADRRPGAAPGEARRRQ